MKYFYWYPTVGVIVLIPHFITFYFFRQGYYVANISNNIALIFHYIFLSRFIINAHPNKKRVFLSKNVFYSFLIFTLYFIIAASTRKINTSAFAMANFGLAIICVIYYHQLFNNIPVIDIKRDASFWIITGVFFCMSLQVPMFGMIEYLRGKVPLSNFQLFSSISPLSYTIMHLFFIKAYLCALHPQKA